MQTNNNYLKLTVRAAEPLHDEHAVPQAESGTDFPLLAHGYGKNKEGGPRVFVTTWVFPFNANSKASSQRALAAAQGKRTWLRALHDELGAEAFQLSTFEKSTLRGVPVVGDVVRTALSLVESTEPELKVAANG